MQPPEPTELLNRLKLIETMMAEGRRTTMRWGWVFVLWGVGPLLAMLWESYSSSPAIAWPVVIGLCVVINGAAIRFRKRSGDVETTATRSVGAVWTSAGTTVLLIGFSAVISGNLDSRMLYAALFGLAATAHGTSSLILRWRPQLLAALVWWLAMLAAFVVPAARLHALSVLVLLLGNVAFGAWLTYREWSHKDE